MVAFKRSGQMVVALLMLMLITSCGPAGQQVRSPTVQQRARGWQESIFTGDVKVGLMIDPFSVGENEFTVVVSDTSTKEVEAQVIMAAMGHGQVVSLQQVDAGRFKAKSDAIAMQGPWLVRLSVKAADGTTRTAVFQFRVD